MFYYLLSIDDFSSLYKYGEVKIKAVGMAESDTPREAVSALFSSSDFFEYAQERVILSSEVGSTSDIKMMDVKDIYPLDSVSKNLFETQFNKVLVFQEPVFEDIANEFLKTTVTKKVTINGIHALRSIFGLGAEEDDNLVKDVILGKSFLRKYKYFEVPFEERTPYSMLIAYNRYNHYPKKDNRGYFYDAADCFMYGYMYADPALQNKGIRLIGYNPDALAAPCKAFFNLMDNLPAGMKFTEVADAVLAANPKIVDAIEPVYGSITFLALFFYVKEKILADETLSMDGLRLLNSIGKKYPEDFSRLLTLIGGYLGYTWIYNRFYEFSGSPFLSTHHSLEDLEQQEAPAIVITIENELKTDEPTITTVESKEELSSQPTVSDEGGDSTLNAKETIEDLPEGDLPEGFPVTIKEEPSDVIDSISVEPVSGKREDIEELDIDIPGIAKAVFPTSCQRRREFEFKLQESHDVVLGFARKKDETGLRGIYKDLDNKFKAEKEQKKLDDFVCAALDLKQKMFND